MAKLSLTDIANLQNEQTVVTALNANSAAIETALENTLSRDGMSPNTMGASLDMNSNRILNLPTALSSPEPVTLGQLTTIMSSGTFPTGLTPTGVTVSSVMQPVLAASTLTAAHTAFGGIASAVYNVEDFGAVRGVLGGASQSTPIQNAVNAAAASGPAGGIVFLPGFYAIATAISVPPNVSLMGINTTISGLYPRNNIDAIILTGASSDGLVLKDFAIIYFIPPSTGAVATAGTAAIRNDILGNAGRIHNIRSVGCYTGISITQSSFFVIDSCFINGFVSTGIFVNNTNNTDSGDSTITNNTLVGIDITATAGVWWAGSGGLRITNNKIVTASNGVLFQMANVTATTGALFIVGNSIEGIANGGGIYMARLGNTGFIRHVIIANNELTGQAGVWIPADGFGAVWIGSLVITGNNYINVSQNGSVGFVLNHCVGFSITGNLMRTLFSTGTAVANLAATCDKGVIGPNLSFAESGGSINASVISSTNTTTITPT